MTKYVLPQGVFLDSPAMKEREADSWMYIGRIPTGTSERIIREECAKYGSVADCFYADAEQTKGDEQPWALISLTPPAKNQVAVQRLNRRLGIFGSSQPVEVRMATSFDIKRVRVLLEEGDDGQDAEGDAMDQSGPGRRRDDSRSRSPYGYRQDPRHGRRSDSREPIKPQREHGLGGMGGPGAIIPKKGPPLSHTAINIHEDQGEFSGGKQVACRFGWAYFVKPDGRYYYVNILTGERRRTLPQT